MLGFLFRSGPPAPAAVVRRLHALHAQTVRALASPPPDLLGQLPAEERRRFEGEVRARSEAMRDSLERSGAWRDMAAEEQRFITASPFDVEPQSIMDASWMMEGAACLLWALGQLPTLPSWDTTASPDLLHGVAGIVTAGAAAAPALRPRSELERMRDIAELWHWRARTRQLVEMGQPTPSLPPGTTLDTIVAQAAALSVRDGLFPAAIDDDFPAFGKAYRDASPEEYALLVSIAVERHRAMNWLCGRAPRNRWTETPTDT